MKKSKIYLIIFLIFIILGLIIISNYCESSTIGSESIGNVVKNNYSHYPNAKIKIAIVSGMHPRETLSSSVLPYVIKVYTLLNNVEIVNYQVTVLESPEDFNIGRYNGEKLVHDFVVEDISKSNYDIVIIGHDHEKGYGEGFYIATPSMDEKSVVIAENLMKTLTNFNYYKRNTSIPPSSSSITTVDTPIVRTGTPLLVYEIPEWLGFFESFKESYSLICSFVKYKNK